MFNIDNKYKGKRYYIRVIDDNGGSSILKNLDKIEFCKQTAIKHANYMWTHHGRVAYVIEA